MFVIVSPVQGANVFMQWHDLHILTEQVVLCFKTFFFPFVYDHFISKACCV